MCGMTPTWEEMERHKVAVRGDAPWQRRLRLAQALWREEQKLPIGRQPGRDGAEGRELGSRIAMPNAKDDLSNYLTDTIRDVLRETMSDEVTSREAKLIKEPRIYDDLLSSQPLCFNLFGELKADLGVASAWAQHLWPERVAAVTRLEFEHSPGRGDPRYLGNRTAFDVYLEHAVPGGGSGFIGIEVKYHEDLQEPPSETRDRVLQVARASNLFSEESINALREPPLQQVWFDHLLALSMLQTDAASWAGNGLFVFLHPVANEACYRVVNAYERHLQNHRTFQRLTLEEVVGALRVTSGAPWIEAFHQRYLGPRP
jgi:hypothetical protein